MAWPWNLAMHSADYAVARCPSVCPPVRPSDTRWYSIETAKCIFKTFSPSGSPTILVFPYQTEWRYSDGNPPNEGVECRWGRQKCDSGRISGFAAYRSIQCYQLWKIKPRRTGASVQPSIHGGVRRPLFAQDDYEVLVTGSTLYAGDGGQPP